jgi:hypothetical protein
MSFVNWELFLFFFLPCEDCCDRIVPGEVIFNCKPTCTKHAGELVICMFEV